MYNDGERFVDVVVASRVKSCSILFDYSDDAANVYAARSDFVLDNVGFHVTAISYLSVFRPNIKRVCVYNANRGNQTNFYRGFRI